MSGPTPAKLTYSPENRSSESENNRSLCPVSRSVGARVGLITLRALLTDALRRLDGTEYLFCPDANCEVVYFDAAAGSFFWKRDLRVRVGAKEREDPIPLCYCFDVTDEEPRREIAARGTTDAPAMIAAEIRAGHCACEVRNPKGTCSLGDISKAASSIDQEVGT